MLGWVLGSFIDIISFDSHITQFSLFGSERLIDLPRVTQLGLAVMGIGIWDF